MEVLTSSLQRSSEELSTLGATLRVSSRSTASSIAKVCFCMDHQALVRRSLPVRLPKHSIAMSHRLSTDLRFLISSSVVRKRKSETCSLQLRLSRQRKATTQTCTLSSLTKLMQSVDQEALGATQGRTCTNLSSISCSLSSMVLTV